MAQTKCCKYHDNMFDPNGETDLNECGMAGMGAPVVCCHNCPDNVYPPGMAFYYSDEIAGKGRTFEVND